MIFDTEHTSVIAQSLDQRLWVTVFLIILFTLWILRKLDSKMPVKYGAPVKGENGAYAINYVVSNGLIQYDDPNVLTLYDTFYQGFKYAKANGDERLLGYRQNGKGPFIWLTYGEVEELADAIANGLVLHGYTTGSMIGIYSRTRPEWMLAFIACQFQSFIAVPLYDTLGDEALIHILRQTKLSVAFVAQASEVKKVLSFKSKCPTIRTLIVFEEIDESLRKQAESEGVKLFRLNEFIEIGKRNKVAHTPPNPCDIFEICYTSGTTGSPKGAVYRHKGLISLIGAVRLNVIDLAVMGKEVFLCYLPLAHAYELAVENFAIAYGFKLGFYSGNARELLDDLQELKPTILTAVPRVLMRFQEGILMKTSEKSIGKMNALIFKLALRQKIKLIKSGYLKKHFFYDRFIFNKIQKSLGGRLKAMFVGSSATHPETLTFIRATLGCYVCEGFGQTESYGISHIQDISDSNVNCIGAPIASVMMKVVDVPEYDYYAKNNEGEMCLKGESIITSYYEEPQLSAEAVDEDGWLHTGDIVRILNNGTVSIIDRKKHFFKLAQGEYVVPSKVEKAYSACKFISEVVVLGNPYRTCCVAIVFPDEEKLVAYAKKNGLPTSLPELCSRNDIKTMFMKDMEQNAIDAGLKGFEKAKNIYLCSTPLREIPTLTTPTMKIKRHECTKFFHDEIEAMYNTVLDKPL